MGSQEQGRAEDVGSAGGTGGVPVPERTGEVGEQGPDTASGAPADSGLHLPEQRKPESDSRSGPSAGAPADSSGSEPRPDPVPWPLITPGPGPGPESGPGAGPEHAAVGPGGPGAEPAPQGSGYPVPVPVSGIMALSGPWRVTAAVALAVIALAATVHLGMVFLHVAPSNTASKQYGKAVDAWIYPEFEQNWKLFAPNPLQQNIAVHVKAEIRTDGGDRKTTGWIDLTAEDGAAIRGNPLPSHTHQNELRRAWDFFTGSHDNDNRATGPRGRLSESYMRRIVMLRLGERDLGGAVERIQLRSSTTSIAPPPWSEEKVDTRPVLRVLPWWNVAAADLPEGSAARERMERTEAAE